VYAASSQLIRLLTRLFLATRTRSASLKKKHSLGDLPCTPALTVLYQDCHTINPVSRQAVRDGGCICLRRRDGQETVVKESLSRYATSQKYVFDTLPTLSCLEGLVRGENQQRPHVGCCDIIFTSALGFIYAFDYTDVQVQVLNIVIAPRR